MVKKFINVSQESMKLKDFNSVDAIYEALNELAS